MVLNVIHRTGPVYLISVFFLLFASAACVSSCSKEAKREAKIKEATKLKYTERVDKLTEKVRNLKSQIPELQRKMKIAIDPKEQGSYVTKIQKIENRLARYKEKLDEYKRRIIQLDQ